MAGFEKIGEAADVPKDGMKAFEVDHQKIVICHIGGEFYALADECTHDGAPVSTGRLKGHEIICPRHGARFSIVDGAVMGPPAVVPIDSFEVRIESDAIYVRLDENDG